MENTGLKFSQHDRSRSSTECRVLFVTSLVICFSLYEYIIYITYEIFMYKQAMVPPKNTFSYSIQNNSPYGIKKQKNTST